MVQATHNLFMNQAGRQIVSVLHHVVKSIKLDFCVSLKVAELFLRSDCPDGSELIFMETVRSKTGKQYLRIIPSLIVRNVTTRFWLLHDCIISSADPSDSMSTHLSYIDVI